MSTQMQSGADVRPMPNLAPFLVALLADFLIGLLRRPALIHTPQFFAEDGTVFFQGAFQNSLMDSTFIPYAGYYHVLPRLLAWIMVKLLPLQFVPLGFHIVSVLIAALSLALIAMPFGRRFVQSDSLRVGLAIALALLPFQESLGKLSYLQWYLLWAMALCVTANAPLTIRGRATVGLCYLVAAFSSGPQLFLCPLILLRVVMAWRADRTSLRYWAMLLAVSLAATATTVISVDSTSSIPWQEIWSEKQRIAQGLIHGLAFYGPVASILGARGARLLVSIDWLLVYAVGGVTVGAALFAAYRRQMQNAYLLWLLIFPAIGIVLRPQFAIHHINSELLHINTRYYFVALCSGLVACFSILQRTGIRVATIALGVVCVLHLSSFSLPPGTSSLPPWEIFARDIELRKLADTPSRVSIPISPTGWTIDLTVSPEH